METTSTRDEDPAVATCAPAEELDTTETPAEAAAGAEAEETSDPAEIPQCVLDVLASGPSAAESEPEAASIGAIATPRVGFAPWLLTAIVGAVLVAFVRGLLPIGEHLQYAVVLAALLQAVLWQGCARRALRSQRQADVEQAADLLGALAEESPLELPQNDPLASAYAQACRNQARTVAEHLRGTEVALLEVFEKKEAALRKAANVELVRVRSECERLVEKYCERQHEEKRELEETFATVRRQHEADRREWESRGEIGRAAQEDAEDRIQALAKDVERLGTDLAERAEECGLLTGEVDRLLEELAETRQQRATFFRAITSHIRRPLTETTHLITEVAKCIDAAEEAGAAESFGEQADEIRRRAAQLGRLMQQVTDLCRLETGAVQRVFSDVDVERLVADALRELRAAAAAKGVAMRSELQGKPGRVSTDATLITKALNEVLHNAVKFTDRGGQIALAVDVAAREGEKDAVTVSFSVSDTGPGVPEEDQQRIFRAFEHGEKSPAFVEDGACGLGLTLAAGFTQVLGGRCDIESRKDEGSTFTLRIPARRSDET